MRLSLLALALCALAGCTRPAAHTAPAPRRGAASARELTIYRTVAESIYVRAARAPVAVARASWDSACADAACDPLPKRWGLDSLWWAEGAELAQARAAREALLAQAHDVLDLSALAVGPGAIAVVAPESLPARDAGTAEWSAFRRAHEQVAGVLRFSPVGFEPGGRGALLAVRWACGPACGHTLAVAMRADDAGAWRIANVLLVPLYPADMQLRVRPGGDAP